MLDVQKFKKYMTDDEFISFLIIYNKVARKQNLVTEQEFQLLKNFMNRFNVTEWKRFKKAVQQ